VTHPPLTPFAPASTELTITDKRVPVHKPGVLGRIPVEDAEVGREGLDRGRRKEERGEPGRYNVREHVALVLNRRHVPVRFFWILKVEKAKTDRVRSEKRPMT
jgi:hypothetical protein